MAQEHLFAVLYIKTHVRFCQGHFFLSFSISFNISFNVFCFCNYSNYFCFVFILLCNSFLFVLYFVILKYMINNQSLIFLSIQPCTITNYLLLYLPLLLLLSIIGWYVCQKKHLMIYRLTCLKSIKKSMSRYYMN